MDSKILPNQSSITRKTENGTPDEMVHYRQDTQPEAPKYRSAKKLPREITWHIFQGVSLDNKGNIIYRSFPFFAKDMESARIDLVELNKSKLMDITLTHLWKFAELKQKSGQKTKARIVVKTMNLQTGEIK